MTAVRTRSRSRLLRDTASSAQVEALLIIAVATILVTRLYLHLTGYPQVGGSVLHIAHVLWGGLLMVAALMVSLTFIGRAPDRIAVLLGGIGFGLFLDEVGKFVTKTNDYFYRPSVAIMYVVVVLLLVVNRAVHLRRGPSPDEYLANAALTATDGLTHGLTPTDRDQARVQLERAREGGVDPEVVEQIDLLLARCREVPSRFSWVALRLPERLRGERSVRVAAALLTIFSVGILLNAAATLEEDLAARTSNVVTVIQLVGSGVTVLLCVVGSVGLWRRRRWAIRALRTAALITVFFVDVLEFAVQEFGALLNVAVGAAALSVFSHHLRQMSRHEALPDTA
ncbi:MULTISPECIES: hypothetical protein [Rhodococcus]|jgi:hypothetical protein|uniref:DUF2157 domain-containing protein n=1 Tax=Rhodococcus rhodochrous TaxID=1829 RepID=A0AAW4XJV2_RHORH|nr:MULTISPECIES: hypothetical protein [Rhodococcus]MCD2113903.1 hypothetical protein [Rhodococcus rhodochrous]QHG81233.1 hypothetical protein D1O33_04245 [Rhodococcus rhodochrous]QOH54766.1 hypothetical protein C6Y44_01395 [Rhodococcus rhodochrous]WAL46815.1 hypothetical protein OQN32_01515 [Rhodococcus pyridinivorans]